MTCPDRAGVLATTQLLVSEVGALHDAVPRTGGPGGRVLNAAFSVADGYPRGDADCEVYRTPPPPAVRSLSRVTRGSLIPCCLKKSDGNWPRERAEQTPQLWPGTQGTSLAVPSRGEPAGGPPGGGRGTTFRRQNGKPPRTRSRARSLVAILARTSAFASRGGQRKPWVATRKPWGIHREQGTRRGGRRHSRWPRTSCRLLP